MKFLTICIFGLVATSYAAKLNVKRGLLGGQEQLNQGYSSGIPAGPQFNAAPLAPQPTFQSAPAFSNNEQQSSAEQFNSADSFAPQPTFQSAPAFSNNEQRSFQPSEPLNNAFPSQAPFLPSQQQNAPQFQAGRSFDSSSHQNQLPQQNYLPPNQVQKNEETIRAIHTHSVERVAQPIHLERTIYKTIAVDRPVPQPYEVIKTVQVPVEKIREVKVPYPVETVKTVQVPYPVEKVREVIKEVKVPAPYPVESVREVVKEVKVPYPVYQEVVKHVPVEKLVPQPYPVVKTVTVDRHVPVLVHHEPQVVHQVAQPVVHQELVHQQQFVQQPVVHQEFAHHQPLAHQQFVQQPLLQHAQFAASPSFAYPQQGQFVANAALPQQSW